MDNYRNPKPEGLKDAREVLEKLYKKEPSEELIKSIEATQEYEEMTCECPMTGTIEIMRRKVEK